jgi:hypothetical protein
LLRLAMPSPTSTKPSPLPPRYQFVVRGWLGHSAFPFKTVALSVHGAQVRHDEAPPAPGTAACARLSLLVGDAVKLVDIPAVVRTSIITRGQYLTELDFVKPTTSVKATLDQVLRGRPQAS